MANKSFVVQYVIKAKEQFSNAARKTVRSSDAMRKSIAKTKKVAASLSVKLTVLKKRFSSVIPTMDGMNAAALRAKASLKGVEDRFQGIAFAGEKIKKAGLALSIGLTLPILFIAKSLKDAARDAQETRSKFDTVFKGMAKESNSAASNLVANFGLSGTSARQLLSDTGDLLTGFGFTTDSALSLSTQVNELAVDLASFTNFSGGAKGASDALTKALLGERESLKSLGIAILEKDVKAKVSQLIAKGQRFETMRQAKAVATLAIAVEQSKNAIGDFARTSGELANQERITSARIQDLKESFGNALLPVALVLTKAIRSIVETLQELSPGAKKVIIVIAGIAAVIGPLLLLIGGLALAIPAITAGFALFAGVSLAALAPVAVAAIGIAAAAELIRRNWGSISSFFGGIATGISSTLGPTVGRLVDQFIEAANIITELFSSESETSKSLSEFANLGELIGTIIGGSLDLIIRGLSGVGAILGQTIAAVTTLDFSNFDIDAIKAQFLGPESQPKADIGSNSRVGIDVNVGLDSQLKQTTPAKVTTSGARRSDVGFSMAGA